MPSQTRTVMTASKQASIELPSVRWNCPNHLMHQCTEQVVFCSLEKLDFHHFFHQHFLDQLHSKFPNVGLTFLYHINLNMFCLFDT